MSSAARGSTAGRSAPQTRNHLPGLQRVGRSVFTRWANLVTAGR